MEEKEMHANSVSHDGLTSEKEIESLHNELAALRDANQKLEADVAEERRLFKMIREERDQYRRILYPPLMEKVPVEELTRFAETCHLDAACTLDDTLKELESMDREHRK